jgi:hypothetical protein
LRQLQSRITRREHGHRRCLLKLHNGGTTDLDLMSAAWPGSKHLWVACMTFVEGKNEKKWLPQGI